MIKPYAKFDPSSSSSSRFHMCTDVQTFLDGFRPKFDTNLQFLNSDTIPNLIRLARCYFLLRRSQTVISFPVSGRCKTCGLDQISMWSILPITILLRKCKAAFSAMLVLWLEREFYKDSEWLPGR
ncbi:hypothetical protein AVEN_47508-1 [Araneus ventricosus]|uniref:Uncharacterized protein n=1 Tax=Araneus ventricosus TaxID=182803 RepID=A0A4Y2FEQ8_ARAVE|nr:hypothetical protein AVEN_47508-1 [Araneus ventricosus]